MRFPHVTCASVRALREHGLFHEGRNDAILQSNNNHAIRMNNVVLIRKWLPAIALELRRDYVVYRTQPASAPRLRISLRIHYESVMRKIILLNHNEL